MSKTIKIPDDMSPYEVIINGVKHIYPAGSTQTVPDDVAALIENSLAMAPHGTRESAQDAYLAGVEKEIADVADDLAELTSDVGGLDDRLDVLDTPETGEIALLDARVTALEEAADTSGG